MKPQKNKIEEAVKKATARGTLSRRIKANDKLLSRHGNKAWPIKNKDFSTVENSRHAVAIIRSIAAAAGRSAASEAEALRIPKVYATKTKVILETADGKKAVIATADNIPGKNFYRKYPAGAIMHVSYR